MNPPSPLSGRANPDMSRKNSAFKDNMSRWTRNPVPWALTRTIFPSSNQNDVSFSYEGASGSFSDVLWRLAGRGAGSDSAGAADINVMAEMRRLNFPRLHNLSDPSPNSGFALVQFHFSLTDFGGVSLLGHLGGNILARRHRCRD